MRALHALRWVGGGALALVVLLIAARSDDGRPGHDPRSSAVDAGAGVPSDAPAADGSATTMAVTAAAAAPQVAAVAQSDAELLQRFRHSSLRGAEVDGEIRLDAHGRLQRDAGLRRLLDHFISLTGEFSSDEIRRLLASHVLDRHGQAVADAVLRVYDDYQGMRHELASLPAIDDLGARLAAVRRVRERWFGDDSDAMFGEQHADVDYTRARLAISRDPGLDDDQRERQLAELDASRPAAARAGERTALSAILAEQQTQQFDHLHSDPATRFDERSALWGEDAAQRLALLDRSRAQWDQRVADYVRQRDRLRSDPRLDAAQRQASLDALLERSFSGNERVRIESLEAIDALPGG